MDLDIFPSNIRCLRCWICLRIWGGGVVLVVSGSSRCAYVCVGGLWRLVWPVCWPSSSKGLWCVFMAPRLAFREDWYSWRACASFCFLAKKVDLPDLMHMLR